MSNIKKLIHDWVWIVLILFCALGLFYPAVGILAIVCMLAPVVTAFFKGRLWCGNFCPRGSFNDVVLSKITRRNKVPKILMAEWFKVLFLVALMSTFAVQIVFAWGSLPAVGNVFVRMVIITTLLSILLGTIYNQRTWCIICPMGNMARYVSNIKSIKSRTKHVKIDKEKCIDCRLCSKNCPMNIDIVSYKENGQITDPSCIKCEMCTSKCPKGALKN